MSNVLDAISGAMWFFAFAIVLLVCLFILNAVTTGGIFSAMPSIGTNAQNFFGAMNNAAIFIMLAVSLGAILSALMIPSHPAFFFISLILVFIEFLVVPPLVNTFNTILTTPAFVGETSTFSLMITVMQNLPVWTAATTFLAALVAIMFRGQAIG